MGVGEGKLPLTLYKSEDNGHLSIANCNRVYFAKMAPHGLQEGSVEPGEKFARRRDFEYSACLSSSLDKSGGQQQNFLALDVSDLVGSIKGKSEPFPPGT